jgi:hypothetical protein
MPEDSLLPFSFPAVERKKVTAAFAAIEAAIQRAGQVGVAFPKLDLLHPELAGSGVSGAGSID